jgi:CheY-like chemotaxis protein
MPVPAQNPRERRVLIVEDNLDSVHAFANMVRRMGHKVDFAINGYAALELAKKTQPEVVFLDLMMPGISGFDVARRLKKDFGDAIRIIVVSAYATDADREESAKAGCELHLAKPVDPQVIERLLA